MIACQLKVCVYQASATAGERKICANHIGIHVFCYNNAADFTFKTMECVSKDEPGVGSARRTRVNDCPNSPPVPAHLFAEFAVCQGKPQAAWFGSTSYRQPIDTLPRLFQFADNCLRMASKFEPANIADKSKVSAQRPSSIRLPTGLCGSS